MYDDETLKQINENVSLLDYASQSLDFVQQGNDEYFAHCPKHVDETPSLSITPSTNSFYCFSCHRSGGVIGYLIQYEDLSFEEAVDKAAKLADIDLSKMCHSATIAWLRKIKQFFLKKKPIYEHRILEPKEYERYKKEPIKEWLNEGIKQEVMDLFGVRADTFQNRIIYPVYDINGNLINIKGRTRYDNYKLLKIPKYMNYFEIGVMDYFQGLNITLPYIKEANEVIIFESIKSVMKAYGWGYKNCISAEKHTLTKEQIKLLVSLKVNIVFAYDSDIDYNDHSVKCDIDRLKRLTNVYIIQDKSQLLGGKEAKNSPADLGEEVWTELYENKKKVVK